MSDSDSDSGSDTSRPSNPVKVENRGRASKYMTPDMTEAVTATFDDFEKQVFDRPLMTKAQEEEMVTWKKTTINAFLDAEEGPFVGCIVPGSPKLKRSAWYRRIYQIYHNRHRYRYKDLIDANRRAHAAAGSVAHPTAAPTINDAQTLKLLRGTWLRMIGKVTPRDIFVEENPELIELKKKEIRKEPGNVAFAGGLNNAAIARAWAECDNKAKYEEMANDVESSVELTRHYFPFLMQTAIRELLQRKTTGDAAIKVLMAWRREDGTVSTSTAAAAYDASNDRELQFPLPDLAAQEAAWGQEAHDILPPLRSGTVAFPTGLTGVPLWADIDLSVAGPRQVTKAIREYSDALWAFAHGSRRPIPVIPYAEIAEDPDQYYDTTKFTLPAPLNISEAERGSLYALADYLAALSQSPTPFQFHSATGDVQPTPGGADAPNNRQSDISPPPGPRTEPSADADADLGPLGDAEKEGAHSEFEDPTKKNKKNKKERKAKKRSVEGEAPATEMGTKKKKKKSSKDKGNLDGEGAIGGEEAPAKKKTGKRSGEAPNEEGERPTKRQKPITEEVGESSAKKSKKRKADHLDNNNADLETPANGNPPPKVVRATKKQKVTAPDENTAPVQKEPALSNRGRRSVRNQSDALTTAPKQTAPPSKRTKVSERYYIITEPIRPPTPPLPM